MTKAEKQAQKYASELRKKYEEVQRNGYMPSIWANIENIWLDGFKAGSEERWHNLKDNPDDLPKPRNNRNVLTWYGRNMEDAEPVILEANRFDVGGAVIAWREITPPKE